MESSDEFGGGEFAANLRARRLAADLTQEQLGKRAGVHLTEISRLERHERDPGLAMIVRLARALKVPPGELLDGIR